MTDSEIGKGQGRQVRRRRAKAATLWLELGRPHSGSHTVSPDVIRQAAQTSDQRFIQDLIGSPELHGQWVTLPIGDIGPIKARKTAAKWKHKTGIDGHGTRLKAIALPRHDTSRNLWTVAINYTPKQ